jgi:type VI secretion system protein ImpA
MSSRSGIDIEALLAPIVEDSPCGRDLRDNSAPTSNYQMVKLARSTARSAERSNVYSDGGQQADDAKRKIEDSWRKILELAPKIIRQESKDLEVACWYTEALVRRDGFAGLRDGFYLLEGLVEHFWDGLFPQPDEYGLETRVGSLKGLNGEGGSEGALLQPIRNCIITNSSQHRPFSYWEYQSAADTQRMLDEKAREKEVARKGYSLQNIESAVKDSSNAFITELRDTLVETLDSYSRLNDRLYQLCGSAEAPPSSSISNLLKECLNAVTYLGGNKFIKAAEEAHYDDIPQEESGMAEPDAPPANSGAQMLQRALVNRDQAFKQLQEIADFFRKTEPHSPISYMIEKAVKWGNMPLHELMQELILDEGSRNRFAELTGAKSE